jgi:predicted metal-binding membrane protein
VTLAGLAAARFPASARSIDGALWLAAGAWQLGPWKERCLAQCRSPFASLMRFAGFAGWTRDLRAGLDHGLNCIGCCAGLMLALVAVGISSVAAMAVIAILIFVERSASWGARLKHVLGLAMMAIGLALVLTPFFVV